jgi:dephospho-CoA kinase
MLIIGLTGSIGMGKSTTAEMFRAEGASVYDSDAAVHQIYSGPAAQEIEALFPGVVAEGVVDRKKLSERVLNDAAALKRLESVVHPLVWRARRAFLEDARQRGDAFAVLDIPLLFEIGDEKSVDVVVVASADAGTQKSRVLARPGMTAEKFAAILKRQLPDAEKRKRADFVVETDRGLDAARAQVQEILRKLKTRAATSA